MNLEKAEKAAQRIRLVVLDVDGVLTDGSIWTGEKGESIKRFYARDGLGIKMLQAAGIPVAILTGRVSAQTAARAAELGIHSVAQGKQFKTRAFEAILAEHDCPASECAYMGDDVPDYEVMSRCGCPCCPADASPDIKDISLYVSHVPGGRGCGRDVIEQVLRAQGKWLADESVFCW